MLGTYGPDSLIMEMLNVNPDERPTIDQVINHPWLNVDISEETIINVFEEMTALKSTLGLGQELNCN